MSVITISKGSFSNGQMLAECLSRSLGYRAVDRDVIVERAAAHGVSQDELRDALLKAPTFLERIQHKKYLYLVLMQAALIEEVKCGKAVYHGNAGHLLLKGCPHILRVRIIAPLEQRVSVAQERLKLSRAEALDYIAQGDQNRRKWAQYLYGVDWADPAAYDVVLNLESMEIPDACRAISTLARQKCFQFTPACQSAMEELALASRVRVELALQEATAKLEVEVIARDHAVRVIGSASGMLEVEDVRRTVSAVPGVETVNLEELVSPDRL
jgi:cytidylate kinase